MGEYEVEVAKQSSKRRIWTNTAALDLILKAVVWQNLPLDLGLSNPIESDDGNLIDNSQQYFASPLGALRVLHHQYFVFMLLILNGIPNKTRFSPLRRPIHVKRVLILADVHLEDLYEIFGQHRVHYLYPTALLLPIPLIPPSNPLLLHNLISLKRCRLPTVFSLLLHLIDFLDFLVLVSLFY